MNKNNHHLFKREGVWYFRKKINGKWIKKALSTSVIEARRLRRDIDLLPPVIEAIERQKQMTCGKSDYVFLDLSGRPMNPDHVRNVIWKPALEKAGITYRPLMQTRHTFATLMLSEGENIGWVQNMLGHGSLQMIFTKYYAWIPKKTRSDGSAFMRVFHSIDPDHEAGEK